VFVPLDPLLGLCPGSANRRKTENTVAKGKRTKGKTTINKTYIKLKI
jgi:hypothetical protein